MIFFYSSNGVGGPWWVPAVFIVLSVFLQGGWFTSLPLSFLFGMPFSFNTVLTYNTVNGWQRRQQHTSQEETGSTWAQLLCIAVAVAASFIICRFCVQFQRQIRRDGIRRTLEMLRQTSWRQWGTLWDAPAGLHQRAGRNNQPPAGAGGLSKQARFEQISKRVQQLPTETFMSKEDLEALPLQDLKDKLRELGLKLKPGEAIDRQEAIKLALEIGGSSSTSCGICCEDYQSQDILRKLPKCGHKFCLACIDRWLLSSTDYSRPGACPMCNTEL